MFEKILVPTDFSKYSQKVLECVGELPGLKEVVLLHVVGPADPLARVWDPGARLEEAKEKIEVQRKYLEEAGLKAVVKVQPVLEGNISRLIESVAEAEKVSLIVMGARGKGLVESVILGNVAKSMVRFGKTHLLIMRYKVLDSADGPVFEKFCHRTFSKVLCPTDFSVPSDQAVSFMKGLEGVSDIELLHVVSQGESKEEIDASYQEAASKLNAMREDLEKSGITCHVHVDVGSPAEEILEVAAKEDVSLIALSSHGMGWLEQLIIGSTAYDVARMGDRPVLIIRANKPE
ncbi:MAG: universal stress protein [Methanotrichaceae archaeon]|nr:universal stress protein [Methanotrichaceae archaeon]